jgi:hypothetical protein
MNRNLYRTLTALLWLTPAAIALRYWQVWDQLPLRVATHFDAVGHANGWMPRDASLHFCLGFIAAVAAVFSVVLILMQWKYPLAKFSWAFLIFCHAEIWAAVILLNSTLDFNLKGTPIVVTPILVLTPVGILALLAIAFVEKRGAALPATDVIAEEIHAGRAWSPLFLLPLAVAVPTLFAAPNLGARLAAAAFSLVFILAFGMAWDGFHYAFTRHGVEIRTLGLRLKSIPLLQIKQYEVSDWRLAGGYGIRGVGNRKAYVWGNHGVRVELYDGQVFLGHSDPQRIVHDLDAIQRYRNS